jgi:uncharacterized protein YndB with AHSA1/START domain
MSKFLYVTYIRTTAEKLFEALIKPEFTRLYWSEAWQDSTWAKGASWKLMIPGDRVADMGEVLEIDRPRRLVLRWRNEFKPEMRAEGFSRCTFELEPIGDAVKLTVIHELEVPVPNSKFIAGVSTGWPAILASLKSLLETGDSLEFTKRWPKDL